MMFVGTFMGGYFWKKKEVWKNLNKINNINKNQSKGKMKYN
jgi:hypothetical protein